MMNAATADLLDALVPDPRSPQDPATETAQVLAKALTAAALSAAGQVPGASLMPALVDALRARPDLLAALLGHPIAGHDAELAGIEARLRWLATDPALPDDQAAHLRFCATSVSGAIHRRQEATRA